MTKVYQPTVMLPCSIIEDISQKSGNPFHMLNIEVGDKTLKYYLTPDQADVFVVRVAQAGIEPEQL